MARDKENYRAWKRQWNAKPENRAKRQAYQRIYRAANPPKDNRAYYQAYYQSNRRKMLASMKARREAELALLAGAARPVICEACGNANDQIVFDHCHKHGHFRGWICELCNKVLGFAKDDINRLRKLVAYLECHGATRSAQLSFSGF